MANLTRIKPVFSLDVNIVSVKVCAVSALLLLLSIFWNLIFFLQKNWWIP